MEKMRHILRTASHLALCAFALTSTVCSSAAQELSRQALDAPHEQSSADRRARNGGQPAEQPPLRVSVVEDPNQTARREASENAARQKEQNDSEAQQLASNLASFQAALSSLALIGAIIALFYTARAANSASKSAEHMASALNHSSEAASAATRSAGAAERAVTTSEEQLAFQRRPMVSIKPFWTVGENYTEHDATTGRSHRYRAAILIHVRVNNIGKGPANPLYLVYNTSFVEGEGNSYHIEKPEVRTEFPMILTPGGLGDSSYFVIEEDMFERIRRREIILLLRARAVYTDVFTLREHETDLVWQVSARTSFENAFNGTEGSVSFTPQGGAIMT